jgi:Uma2 family endonuclease
MAMVERIFGLRTVDLRTVEVPYMLRLYDVTDEMFDEMVDEDTKAELIDGVMIVHSPATLRHDDVANFLRTLMNCYVADKDLGCVLGPDGLVRIKKGRRVGADLFFLRKNRMPRPLPKEYKGAPDLMLEVLSPSNRDYDLNDKRSIYRQAGVREIWFVDPLKQQIIRDRRRGHRYVTKTIYTGRVESSVIRGFWIKADWLWSDPLPNVMQCLRDILA